MESRDVKAKYYYSKNWAVGTFTFKTNKGDICLLACGPFSITPNGCIDCSLQRIDEETICQNTGLIIGGREAYENDIYHDGDESVYRITWNAQTASYVFESYGWDESAEDFGPIETLAVNDLNDFYDLSSFTYVGNFHDFESMEAAYKMAITQITQQEEERE